MLLVGILPASWSGKDVSSVLLCLAYRLSDAEAELIEFHIVIFDSLFQDLHTLAGALRVDPFLVYLASIQREGGHMSDLAYSFWVIFTLTRSS